MLSIEYINHLGCVCYGLVVATDEQNSEFVHVHPFTKKLYLYDENEDPYLKDMSELILIKDKILKVIVSSIVRRVYVILESYFIQGEIVFRYGMIDLFFIKSKDILSHDTHFGIPSFSELTAWDIDLNLESSQHMEFLLFRCRLIKVVQHALSLSKGFKSVITIPNIACGRIDFLKLIALAKGSVVKEFDKNIITYNSVHTSNSGCNQVSGLKTILKAILSCPSILDQFLGYR
jgi:hypothetical protein